MSNIKEVSRYCSPEVQYLMISCRPHYLPREFSSTFFMVVYLSPQTDAGTKTTLNELYTAISKLENTHPEAVLLVAGDFNIGKLKSVFTSFLLASRKATLKHAWEHQLFWNDCVIMLSIAAVSMTFKQVNIHKVAGLPGSVLRACTNELSSIFTDL